MATLTVEDDLAAELNEIAARENRSLDDVLRSMLEIYKRMTSPPTTQSNDALRAMLGTFDDDVTDLSSTVRETMDAFYREKFGRSD